MKVKSLLIRFLISFFLIFVSMFLLDMYKYSNEGNSPLFVVNSIERSVDMSIFFSSVYILQEIRKRYEHRDFKRKRNILFVCIFFFVWALAIVSFLGEKSLNVTNSGLAKTMLCGLALAIFDVILVYALDSFLNRKKKRKMNTPTKL